MDARQQLRQLRAAAKQQDHARVVGLGPACVAALEQDALGWSELANAHAMLGRSLTVTEQLAAGAIHLERALYGPQRDDLTQYTPEMLAVGLANTYLKQGRYVELTAALEPLLGGRGTPAQQGTAHRLAAAVTWRLTGDLDAAGHLLERGAIAAGRAGSLWWRDAVYRGQFLMELDRLAEAQGVLRHGVMNERAELGTAVRPDPAAVANLSLFLGALARVEVRLGNVEQAQGLHVEAVRLLPADRRFGQFAHALVASEIAAARGDWDDAARGAGQCLEITLALEVPPSIAVSHRTLGCVAAGRDRVPSARESFHLALAAFERLGHVRDIAAMAVQLAQLGG